MRVAIHIEGPIGVGKTQLAQFIEKKLREEYSVELVGVQHPSFPIKKEVYRYNIAPL